MIKTTPRTHVQFCEHIPFENGGESSLNHTVKWK